MADGLFHLVCSSIAFQHIGIRRGLALFRYLLRRLASVGRPLAHRPSPMPRLRLPIPLASTWHRHPRRPLLRRRATPGCR